MPASKRSFADTALDETVGPEDPRAGQSLIGEAAGDDEQRRTTTEIRASVSLCPACRTRLVRRGDRLLCPRCDLVTRQFSRDGLCEAVEPDASDWARALVGLRLGDFRIESLLGEGAAGAVFLACHAHLRRRSALKVLSPRLARQDVGGLRFLDEARTASSLAHPNVVTTHSVGEDEVAQLGPMQWIEQEFVPGRSLGDYLDRWTLQPAEAARLLVDIASGLAAAHRSGLVHRDVKPDNILLTHCRTAKLGDFGLARSVELSPYSSTMLVGTPNFMAPEIFAGEEPTPATDVFSLGVTLYVMLAGEPPFARDCRSLDELSAAIGTRPLPAIRQRRSDVPLEMAECLAILTDRSPENRPVDGVEALQHITALLGHVRDLETLIRTAMRDEPCVEWRRVPASDDAGRPRDRYELDVHLPGERSQRVYLEETDGPYSERNVTIDSVCGPADPEHFDRALRLNASVAHGAIAIKPHGGRDCFVMVDTYPRGTLDAEEVRRSVWELAVYADQMEQILTGDDEY